MQEGLRARIASLAESSSVSHLLVVYCLKLHCVLPLKAQVCVHTLKYDIFSNFNLDCLCSDALSVSG